MSVEVKPSYEPTTPPAGLTVLFTGATEQHYSTCPSSRRDGEGRHQHGVARRINDDTIGRYARHGARMPCCTRRRGPPLRPTKCGDRTEPINTCPPLDRRGVGKNVTTTPRCGTWTVAAGGLQLARLTGPTGGIDDPNRWVWLEPLPFHPLSSCLAPVRWGGGGFSYKREGSAI
jgi:hypothetical protein